MVFADFGWFWLVLLLVLGGFGWIRVSVTALGKYTKRKVHNITLQGFATLARYVMSHWSTGHSSAE